MPTSLSQHFQDCRLQRKLTLGQLSRIVGYRDTGKGAGRINKFEQTGVVHADLLGKLSAALGIEPGTVEALIEQDRRRFVREWLAWATEPIRPYVIVRMMAAFYVTEEILGGSPTLEEAEAFAAERAKHWKKLCCLVWTRRHSVWFDEAGEVYDRTEALAGLPNTPFMRLGSRRRPFLVRSLSPQHFVRAIEWPPDHLGPKGREEEKTWD